MGEPIIRQYIAPGGPGWVIALIVLVLCIIAGFFGLGHIPTPVLALVGALAVARLI